MTRRLFRKAQAQEYLGGVPNGSFWRWRKAGWIKAIHIGRSIFFDRKDLDAFIEDRKGNPSLNDDELTNEEIAQGMDDELRVAFQNSLNPATIERIKANRSE
jgi:hypothetical protein